MVGHNNSNVFISYAHKDGADLAQRLQRDLAAQGFDAWLDRQRLHGGAVWSTQIEQEIDTRQITIALLSPGSYASEICRAEQLRALDKGNRVIPVLAVKGADRPLYLYARQYRDFTDAANYTARLSELLADISGDATATLPGAYRKTRVTYLTAPPRVANYLERTEAVHALRNALFAEDHRQPIALTALAGMGGIGKTVLAKALTEDEVVQRAFPDGIVWITAGKERKRDFLEEMREVAKALGDDLSGYDTALACEHQYRTTIAHRAALIVVDDVWSKADIEPLLAESPRSRFLFTTRDASIGRFVSAREHRVELLDPTRSRELLASWANLPVAELPLMADEIVGECGRLPLALSIIGAMLRDATPEEWEDTLRLLRKADLTAIAGQLPPGQESFFRAVEVSFAALAPEMQQRYKALAVLLEDMAAPIPILRTLWGVSEPEARRISRQFADRSLAQRHGETASIRLHDLQLDYVRAQYPDREALDLLQGAVRLSLHVIERDPDQFSSQMIGRLLPHRELTTVRRFTDVVIAATSSPWLRPLRHGLHPPGGALVRTLTAHTRVAISVALIPDSTRAISASYDRTLRIWDIEAGKLMLTLVGHRAEVNAVAVTSDGRRAISASYDKTLKVWDLYGGRELRTFAGHSDTVRSVALAPDGQAAVSGCADGTIGFWDLAAGAGKGMMKAHDALVSAVAISLDSLRMISAAIDGSITVWDLLSRRKLLTLTGHTAAVRAIAVSPNGRRLASGSADQKVKIWDLKTGVELQTLTGHLRDVNGVAMMPDGRRAISSSSDGTLRIWDLSSGALLQVMEGPCTAIFGLAVIPDMSKVISTCGDGTLNIWRLQSGTDRSHRVLGYTGAMIADLAIASDGDRVVSASSDGTLKVWDFPRLEVARQMKGHTAGLMSVALNAEGNRAVSGSIDGTVSLWDLPSARMLATLIHLDKVAFAAVAMTPDGRRAVAAGDAIRVWNVDAEPATLLWAAKPYPSAVSKLAVTCDGTQLLACYFNGELALWDLESGAPLRRLRTATPPSQAMCLVGARKVCVGSGDTAIRLWDLQTGQEVTKMNGHTDTVRAISATLDGRLVISGSADKTVRVWHCESGRVLAVFTADAPVTACSVTPDGRTIVAGDESGRVHFLQLEL